MKTDYKYVAKGATEPPTVEVDTEAGAAYIRFKNGKVCRTVPQEDGPAFVTFDLDAQGEVLGVELIGVGEFTIQSLLKNVPLLRGVSAEEATRYVSVPRQLQEA